MQTTIAYLANRDLDYAEMSTYLCKPMDKLCKLHQITQISEHCQKTQGWIMQL